MIKALSIMELFQIIKKVYQTTCSEFAEMLWMLSEHESRGSRAQCSIIGMEARSWINLIALLPIALLQIVLLPFFAC